MNSHLLFGDLFSPNYSLVLTFKRTCDSSSLFKIRIIIPGVLWGDPSSLFRWVHYLAHRWFMFTKLNSRATKSREKLPRDKIQGQDPCNSQNKCPTQSSRISGKYRLPWEPCCNWFRIEIRLNKLSSTSPVEHKPNFFLFSDFLDTWTLLVSLCNFGFEFDYCRLETGAPYATMSGFSAIWGLTLNAWI